MTSLVFWAMIDSIISMMIVIPTHLYIRYNIKNHSFYDKIELKIERTHNDKAFNPTL